MLPFLPARSPYPDRAALRSKSKERVAREPPPNKRMQPTRDMEALEFLQRHPWAGDAGR